VTDNVWAMGIGAGLIGVEGLTTDMGRRIIAGGQCE